MKVFFDLHADRVFADDKTVSLVSTDLAPGQATPITRHLQSDAAYLFFEGSGQVRVADRVHKFNAVQFAHSRSGTAHQIENTGTSTLRFLRALCPPGPEEQVKSHDPRGSPGGVSVLKTDVYDRIPDSGAVRGGMYFLEAGGVLPYLSQDESTKVFVVLEGNLDLTVGDQSKRIAKGDVVVIPRQVLHNGSNPGPGRLAMWVTVTPNTTPSHTWYEKLPDGSLRRRDHQARPSA